MRVNRDSRRPLAVALCVALALAGCATTDLPEPVTPSPCVSVSAEPEPIAPVLTDAQRLAVDRATITALGAPLAAALTLYRDVTLPEWGRRAAASRDAAVASCAAR